MLLSLLIVTAAIFSTNGNPVNYYQTASQVPVDQQFVQQIPNVNYFDIDDSQSTLLLEQTADFTVSCAGQDRICTRKNDCPNGYFHVATADFLLNKEQACRVQDEVCCQVIVDLPIETSSQDSTGAILKSEFVKKNPVVPKSNDGVRLDLQVVKIPGGQIIEQTRTNGLKVPTHLQLGCAAALLCVEEQFCTVDGTISPTPVSLTSRQLLQRVPLSPCKHPETRIIGRCCRDPNYVDPWPAGNLPANFTGTFDIQGFPTILNINTAKPEQITESSNTPTTVLVPPPKIPEIIGSDVDSTNIVLERTQCGVRHRNPAISDSRTVFGEIPWQAMVLHSRDRKILCSGALVSTQDVLTAANCVDSMLPRDVSIKVGEWKLGYELKHEEPLPYEILNVSYINMHPDYRKGYGDKDLAILHLEKPAALDQHVNPLCLCQTNQLHKYKSCIATGWGKSILQAHYTGAILHAVDMNILSSTLCKDQLLSADVNTNATNGVICTVPKKDINNVCEADVGGPLACKNEQGYYELAGTYSQDTGCLPTNQVAMFAPCDNPWLTKIILTHSSLSEDNQYLPPN